MLVLILPSLLLLIVGGVIASAYMIYKPQGLANLEDKAKAQRPTGRRRTPPRRP